MKSLKNFKEYDSNEHDFELKDLVQIISDYKKLIIFISFLFLIFTNLYIYLYFPPKIYDIYSIIEVKNSKNKQEMNSNDLLKNVFHPNNRVINQEIEILKTYKINKKVIQKINFKTQFFINKGYKKNEIYKDRVPIKIKKIKILNKDIIGKTIKIHLQENGYLLEIENSEKDKLISKILKKKQLSLKSTKLNPYGKTVITKYFKCSISNIKKNLGTLYFKINGNIRDVYDLIIKNQLSIEQLNKDTSLIKISYKDNIPTRGVDYINNLVNIFIEEERKSKNKKNNTMLKFIEKQLKSIKVELKSSESKLRNYKVKHNIINIPSQSNEIINKLSNIEVKISKNSMQLFLIKNIFNGIKEQENFNTIGTYLKTLNDKSILDQLNHLNKLNLEEITLRSEYTDEYPKLIEINKQIALTKAVLFQNIQHLKSSIEYKISNLKKEKKRYRQTLSAFPQKEITQINLKNKYDVSSTLYIYFLKKKEENKMINVATSANSDYKIVEEAYASKSPINQKRSMLILTFTFLGFIVGILIAIILNLLSSTIKNIKHNQKWLFFQELHLIKHKKHIKIEVLENPQSPFADSYRRLRTDLQFLLKSNSSNILLVTSTLPKEGKSTVIINLGAILQLGGLKTILIDLDLRKPILDKYFDINCPVGISNYLNNLSNIQDIICKTMYQNLDIIPVGEIPSNPSELLLSSNLNKLFNRLRDEYDYILINSSAIEIAPDMISLIEYSDINLFIFRRGFSKKRFITQLEEMMIKYNLKNVGVIMNSTLYRKRKIS